MFFSEIAGLGPMVSTDFGSGSEFLCATLKVGDAYSVSLSFYTAV